MNDYTSTFNHNFININNLDDISAKRRNRFYAVDFLKIQARVALQNQEDDLVWDIFHKMNKI